MIKSKLPSCTLLISTYNWSLALNACLKSVLEQRVRPKQIVIADDGSGEDTKQVIDNFRSQIDIPVLHIWHPDEGFRLAAIRNKAIAKAVGEYIIQIDGDLILHHRFIEDHLLFAKKNSFVRASRIYMDTHLSNEFIKGEGKISILDSRLKNKLSALRLPFLWPLFESKYKIKGSELFEIHGCNMAYWRGDAIKINGYNEEFVGWGPEDKEFVVRLLNNGVQKRFIKLGALAYHIWHKENSKTNLKKNELILTHAKEENIKRCKLGIDQYLI